MHTDTTCVQCVNVGLAQAHPKYMHILRQVYKPHLVCWPKHNCQATDPRKLSEGFVYASDCVHISATHLRSRPWIYYL